MDNAIRDHRDIELMLKIFNLRYKTGLSEKFYPYKNIYKVFISLNRVKEKEVQFSVKLTSGASVI